MGLKFIQGGLPSEGGHGSTSTVYPGISLSQWRKVAVDEFLKLDPNVRKLFMPRRVVSPQGYANPASYAFSAYSEFMEASVDRSRANDQTFIRSFALNSILVGNDVPTFFVTESFLDALSQTDPPDDVVCSDLMWPHDAMLFALPLSFSLRYLGFEVGFLAIGKAPRGEMNPYRGRVVYPDFPELEAIVFPEDKVVVAWRVSSGIVDTVYSSAVPSTYPVSKAIGFTDFTDYTDDFPADLRHLVGLQPTAEQELKTTIKMRHIAFSLVLAMNAKPEFLERTSSQVLRRPGKVGKKQRDELWDPLFIGRGYASEPRELGGTHVSPRTHWRRAHWNTQHYGPRPWTRDSASKLVWIERRLINA